MDRGIFKYQFSKTKTQNGIFSCLIQYTFFAKCLSSNKKIEYVFDLFKLKSYLYITVYYPAIWDGHSDRTNKLLSKEEDLRVNFRKMTLTCFYIFHKEVSPHSIDAAFVANGSLVKGEQLLPGLNISRKLKLYWEILKPVAEELNYRIVEVLEYNAIVLIKKESNIPDQQIWNDYAEFKKGL